MSQPSMADASPIRHQHFRFRREFSCQQGMTLIMLVFIIGLAGTAFLLHALNANTVKIEQSKQSAIALAQAKEALIGYAVTYRDSDDPNHANDVFGYLPAPDLGSSRNGTAEEGNAAANFSGNSKNLTVIGRLPWRTLGLSPLRDGNGECLWYAVSGSFQNNQKADALNWDSLGHFDVYSSDGTLAGTISLTGTNYHKRPVAIIFSPGAVLPGQNRQPSTTDAVSTCGGNYDAHNYLDSFSANANIQNIVNYFAGTINNSTGYVYGLTSASDSTPLIASQLAAPKNITFGDIKVDDELIANDKIIVLTAEEIFNPIKKRNDFKGDIDTMLADLVSCLNSFTVANLPATSADNKGITDVITACPASSPRKINVLGNWRDNLLYIKPATASTVNSSTGCNAVLFFGGTRTASQGRTTVAEKNVIANYLEEPNASIFPTGGNYTGASEFNYLTSSADIALCIEGQAVAPPAPTQSSFATDFAKFTPTGTKLTDTGGVATYSTGATTDANNKTVRIDGAAGTSGACAWYPDTVPLAGKTLRAYYEYQFLNADTYALTSSGTDRGNGFTLQIVGSDIGSPAAVCGREIDMGALTTSTPLPGSNWSLESFTIETDVRRNAGTSDPVENHTAIMAFGSLAHGATVGSNGYLTTDCNGTAAGCRHTPANKFEESPSPQLHKQRTEIHSGCDSTCSSCNPASHVAPNTYVRITTWVDCTDCSDVAVNLDRTAKVPTINRCIDLDTAMNSIYFGFTAGFRSASETQGVTISNFILRSE